MVDIAICGAGIAGGALACAMAQAGMRVGLIERAPSLDISPLSGDARALAISPVSAAILHNLGIWDHLEVDQCGWFRGMHVWEGPGEIHFDCSELGQPFMGYIVPFPRLLRAVHQRLAECEIEWFRPARVKAFAYRNRRMQVELDTEQTLDAEVLAGADGGRSEIRSLAGIPLSEHDYQHVSVTAAVTTERSHRNIAWQRFVPDGPLAFLPLADPHRSSVVWSVEPDLAKRLVEMDEEAFGHAIAEVSQRRLGNITAADKPGAYPLRRRHAAYYTQPGLALVADAAHTVHPLAGQGINLGLLDVAELAETWVQARRKYRPLGAQAVLDRYQHRRRWHNLLMQDAMGGMRYLFGNPIGPVQWARNFGMSGLDRIPPLKRLFVYTASGFGGDVPRLARQPFFQA